MGPWDELLEVAVDIRKRLRDLTDGKLTISAGLGMFTHSFPITKMAEITGELETVAKDMPTKDSIALFGFDTSNLGQKPTCHHVYQWDQLIDRVLDGKFKMLQSLLAVSRDGVVSDTSRMPFMRSSMYRIMELLEEIVKENSDRIHKARCCIHYQEWNQKRQWKQQKEA